MSYKRELELVQARRAERVFAAQNNALSLAESMYMSASLDANRDKLKAALTMQAMNNTATLATKAEQYMREAPYGQEEYQKFVKLYAALAATKIMEGNW